MKYLTYKEVVIRAVLVALVICFVILLAESCSAAYITVPKMGAIMDNVRSSASTAAAEISNKGIVRNTVDFSKFIKFVR